MKAPGHSVIESIGVHLPAREVTTEEIVKNCRRRIVFPLERVTGIRSRRTAGDTEFSIDLAKRAVEVCLARSKYAPVDVGLVIAANICRCDGPKRSFQFEPSTSVRLREHFGFSNAVVFDVSNACTGMWTAILIADSFLAAGLIDCALIVSGEYITHLTETAQVEIDGLMDPRLASLTLGDAGAAVMLERGFGGAGLHEIEMYTLGRYSSYCVAQPTTGSHGGAVMTTDSLGLAAVSIPEAGRQSARLLRREDRSRYAADHLILHQTSKATIADTVREINQAVGSEVFRHDNVVFNLAERGNTATTSHFVALWDKIHEGVIRSGDRVVFGIGGSGITLGTALYTLDELPDRVRNPANGSRAPAGSAPVRMPELCGPRARIESIGTGVQQIRDTVAQARHAALDCLARSRYEASDIDLLVFAGVYRTGLVLEPAIAALVAGALDMNATETAVGHTLAFDVFNGALGFLNACHIVSVLIAARRVRRAMVVASEVDNNAGTGRGMSLGVRETGAAVILDQAPDASGFHGFHFHYATEHVAAESVAADTSDGRTYLEIRRAPDLEKRYLECILSAVASLHAQGELDLQRLKLVCAPQRSSAFLASLARGLGLTDDKLLDVVGDGTDLYTSSFAHCLGQARRRALVAPGDQILVIGAGSGIQVCSALYDC